MKILLITPPFTQLNTPYPATTQLKAYLKQCGHEVLQYDLGIALAEKIYTRDFLQKVFSMAFNKERLSSKAKKVALQKDGYLSTIDAVWRFLQGKDDTLSTRIASREMLPEASRFKKAKDDLLEWAFGTTGFNDRAKHISTLYIEDLTDFIAEIVTPSFGLVRYGEQLSQAAESFDYIEKSIEAPINIIDTMMIELLSEKIKKFDPELIGFSIPFPGTLYGALKCGEYIKKEFSGKKVVIGGGYINTELREISDARIFKYTDYMLFDDGELPLERLCEYFEKGSADLVRTKYLDGEIIVDYGRYDENIKFGDLPAPDFSDLDMSLYVSMIEMTNPMHKLWSDGRWNKMTVAHGCYWAKCTFCDTSLDYICRYEAPGAKVVVDKMEAIMSQTGISGFHFTDEALPPKLMREISQEIIDRNICVSFWGNIRFEKNFDDQLCELLSKAGCVAVSGGIEVASARILKLIDKGVTIEQARNTMASFADAGIMVHAYLMYGFPTQTIKETLDSLEVVRRMFEEGIVQSAFWHRYAMTVHSHTGQNPDKYGVKYLKMAKNPFANNGILFEDEQDIDRDKLGEGLTLATYNYMQGVGYDTPIKKWFPKDLFES